MCDASIKEMSKGCGLWSGNAIAWFNFTSGIVGDLEVTKPSSCSLAGKFSVLLIVKCWVCVIMI